MNDDDIAWNADRRRWLYGLIAAYASVYVVSTLALVPLRPSIPLAMVSSALMLAQPALLAGWFVLGDGSWRGRLALLFLGPVAALLLLSAVIPFHVGLLLALAAVQAALTIIPFAVARRLGWACRLGSSVQFRRGPMQFSIWQILVLTAIVAVLARVLLLIQWDLIANDLRYFAVLAITTALLGWVAWPVMLGFHPSLASAMLVSIGVFLGAMLNYAWPVGQNGEVGILIILQGIIFAACLSVLRAAGYQLTRA